MMLTPALVAAGPRLADLASRSHLGDLDGRRFNSARVGSAHAYLGHVLIVGFGVTGRNLAHTARLAGVPYAVLEINAGTVRAAAAAGEPIHFGDGTHETILLHVDADKARAIVVVIDDPAGARRIVEMARRVAPEAYIIVRSRYLREVEPLLHLGADEVIADEMEVSIEVFSRVLSRMLVPREDIKRLIGEVRGDWRRMSRSLAPEATHVGDLRVSIPELTTHSVRLGVDTLLHGKTIAESRLRPDHGVTVLAIDRAGGTIPNPTSAEVLEAGDVLFVVAPPEWDPATIA
jgi:CPA2 family monovalent cation:H+ antiporter-2